MSRPKPQEIDTRVAVIGGKLDVLAEREAELQAILDSIRAERLALQAEYDDLQSKRVPFNWLPPELVTEIFLYCIEDSHADPEALFDPIPVALSHVSRRWRSVALATPPLWRRLHLQLKDTAMEGFTRPAVDAFVSRRETTSVQLVYSDLIVEDDDLDYGLPVASIDDSSNRLHLFDQLVLTSLVISGGPSVLLDGLTFLRAQFRVFLRLESLELVATVTSAPATLFYHFKSHLNLAKSFRNPFDSQSFPCLKKLTLRDVSPALLPITNYPELRELTVQVAHIEHVQMYMPGMRVQYLARVLACAPKVERLVLMGGGPVFHARVEDGLEEGHWSRKSSWVFGLQSTMPPVPLERLRELCWTDAHPEAIYYLLTHFPANGLEVLDISLLDVEKHHARRPNMAQTVVPLTTLLPTAGLLPPVLAVPGLKILRVECTSCDVLRLPFLKLAFPALETLSLANVDPALATYPRRAPLPHLPRPESIFRDPRMPHLTHLILSAFGVLEEHAGTMFGYMPALERLDCDMVEGGMHVLAALAATRRVSARVMRCCPALRTIHLWECNDVQFPALERLVKLRNGFAEPEAVVPVVNGHIHHHRKAAEQKTGLGSGSAGERKIKPLKRSVRGAQIPQGLGGVEEMQPCVPITDVRIEKCKLISEEQARSLEKWGVEVVWG
ncbi:hypothetical protein DENSPDRAFT_843259 [Dentipellis sp. KUC8613]|nr:hypothetical protein DENSPDRAFT_843259 [Dentipellis sp. KUC8613]